MDTPVQSRRQIYLVDDHPLVREWLANLIRRQPDLEVCGQAESVEEALIGIAATKPDVVVLDLSLKNSSGLDLLKDLKKTCAHAAALVLSMHEEVIYAERALRAGARGYIIKRESTGAIVEAIRQILQGQVYVSESIVAEFDGRDVAGLFKSDEPSVKDLSERELEVFRLIGRGVETRLIAEKMSVSMKTVQAYAARIKLKLGLNNANELMREAVRWLEAQRK